MEVRCPLCKTGLLSGEQRALSSQDAVILAEVWSCTACREVVLDATQIEKLRASIRREGLATSEEHVEELLERLMLQSG